MLRPVAVVAVAWYVGRASCALTPPPDPLHAVSPATVTAPVAAVDRLRLVPPTAMTHGLYAGYPPGFPRSPVEKTHTAFVSLQLASNVVSPDISPLVPQLLLMTDTPVCLEAYEIAAMRSDMLLEFASTRRMPAAGAPTSTADLSVSTTNSGSSLATVSPSFFSHSVMVPSSIVRPSKGIVTWCGMRDPSNLSSHHGRLAPHSSRLTGAAASWGVQT